MTHDNFLSDEIRAIDSHFVQSVVNTIDIQVAWKKTLEKCDELIAKIKREEDFLKTYIEGNGFVVTDALRAVVELHKPISYPSTSELPLECTVCRAEPYYSTNEVYPCPTIQAIEKELG